MYVHVEKLWLSSYSICKIWNRIENSARHDARRTRNFIYRYHHSSLFTLLLLTSVPSSVCISASVFSPPRCTPVSICQQRRDADRNLLVPAGAMCLGILLDRTPSAIWSWFLRRQHQAAGRQYFPRHIPGRRSCPWEFNNNYPLTLGI